MSSWVLFLLFIIICLIAQGFYSMLEMACVSFNRVRLQYHVSLKSKRAKWLHTLLNHPTRLFGTTLIGVNTAMQFGSECARRFYASLGIDPDWAPLMQVTLVVLFAELSPMFAARRYAESVAMLGIPVLYFTSLIMRPILFVFDIICRFVNYLCGMQTSTGLFLTREDLQKAIEGRDDDIVEQTFDPILANIFALKTKTIKDIMLPLQHIKCIPSKATIEGLKELLGLESMPFVPVYYHNKNHIVAIAYPRDLLRLPDKTPLHPYCRSPWFITETCSVLEIIKEFRLNNQSLAIVLNDQGRAIGILTLDIIVDEIFGQRDDWVSLEAYSPEKHKICIDRSFSGDILIKDINQWLDINLPFKNEETLKNLMESYLNHNLEKGDSIRIEGFELSVEAHSLITGPTILIRSLS